MEFIAYPKVHRIGKEEVEGILDGYVSVQEKIDGANTQIWKDADGNIRMGSRSQEITEGFNGFVEYVKNNEDITKLLTDHPEFHLYGEWLVKHSISYNETAYRKFYLFDILVDGEFMETDMVNYYANMYDIPHPQFFGNFENISVERLKEFVGQTTLGKDGEGIVIKNRKFVDKFGNNHCAKIVTENFKELNGVTFGGNNKHSDVYMEMYIVNKYMTLPRIEKIMHKMQPMVDKRLDMEHLPMIMGAAYHDMLTEEIWEIAKKADVVSFKALRRVCYAKAKQIFVDIINDQVSVADRSN
jgi:RNA ligase-like protein